jgi:hypothetical protein
MRPLSSALAMPSATSDTSHTEIPILGTRRAVPLTARLTMPRGAAPSMRGPIRAPGLTTIVGMPWRTAASARSSASRFVST